MQSNEREGEKPRRLIRSNKLRLIVTLCVFLVIVAIGPAAVCEVQTSLHIDEFEGSQIDAFGESRRVISYSLNEAKIYVWSDGSDEGEERLGGMVRLTREFREDENVPWEVAGWEPYWAADEQRNDRVVWQYWWHFVYFLL